MADQVDLCFSTELDLAEDVGQTGGAPPNVIGDAPALQPKEEEGLDPIGPWDSAFASQAVAPDSIIAARLERLPALAQEIASLSRKRLAAVTHSRSTSSTIVSAVGR